MIMLETGDGAEVNKETMELIQQLPVTAFVEMRNYMYSSMLMAYLHKLANNRGKPIYTFKEDGMKICQALLQRDEVDETLLIKFEQMFQEMIAHERDTRFKVMKKFTKLLSNDSSLIDSIPLTCVRNALQQAAELNHAKEVWRDEVLEESALPTITAYLYTLCLNNMREYFEEPFASSF